jgi:hypothetical protein
MPEKISCFVACSKTEKTQKTIHSLIRLSLVDKVTILAIENHDFIDAETLVVPDFLSTHTISLIAGKSTSAFTLMDLKGNSTDYNPTSLERMVQVALQTEAAMVYAGYHEIKNGQLHAHPVIDYQEGSLRDDFVFGPVQLFRTDVLRSFAEESFRWAGLYALRLHASRRGKLIHIPELLFTSEETDPRRSEDKQFDYVSRQARDKQAEMEKACTSHLKKTGAFLKPDFKKVDLSESSFPLEASVVIPVRNRITTIDDAIRSVVSQKTGFPFNLIVVDNHSTDGTTDLLRAYAHNEKLITIFPARKDLGIGGCWNEAISDPRCGKFAVQLDSDDLYADEHTLERMVDTFYQEKCAMVIGSYRMVDLDLKELPPGIIRHEEWTPDNGPNNALRINGLGAPRAFYTPILRKIKFPNVSYGEDYAVGLTISRTWKIGRIYDPLYLCRRWEDNTDAALTIEKQNENNRYKDWIRSVELTARIRMNSRKSQQAPE